MGWYVIDKTGKHGPLTAETIREKLRNGQLSFDTYVQREGSFVKRRVGDISLFFRDGMAGTQAPQPRPSSLPNAVGDDCATVMGPGMARTNVSVPDGRDGKTRILIPMGKVPAESRAVAPAPAPAPVAPVKAPPQSESGSVEFSISIANQPTREPEKPKPATHRPVKKESEEPADAARKSQSKGRPTSADRRVRSSRPKSGRPRPARPQQQSSRRNAPKTLGHVVMQQRAMASQARPGKRLSWELIVFVVLLCLAILAVVVAFRVSRKGNPGRVPQPRPVATREHVPVQPPPAPKPQVERVEKAIEKPPPPEEPAHRPTSARKPSRKPSPPIRTPRPRPTQRAEVPEVGLARGWPRPISSGRALTQRLGQDVTIQGLRVKNVPAGCTPCRIAGRMSDGTVLMLSSPGILPWQKAGVQGAETVNVMGRLVSQRGNEFTLIVREILKTP